MAEPSWPYRFEVIDLDELYIDRRYQRPMSKPARQLVTPWDPAMVGSLVVNQRKRQSKYAVIDGQTRLWGAEQAGVPALPAVVYEGLSPAQEADLFARLQQKRRNITTWLRFRAQVVAKDPDSLAIAALVRAAGFKMAGDEDDAGIRAVSAVESLYRRDPEILKRTLQIIGDAWGRDLPERSHTDQRVRTEVIRGIGRFLIEEEGVDDARLVDRLRAITPVQLRHRANALREGSGSSGNYDKFIADALVGVYATRARRAA